MPHLFSMHIPNPEHAVGPACVQLLLIAILAAALSDQLKQLREEVRSLKKSANPGPVSE